MNTSGFRNDINGLRAWAVVAVMLYHFALPGFGGGFVGVDVFFVISGFLMTGIVVGGLLRNDFSILSFYLARARRIVPALVVLCAVLLFFGWWLLLPLDYQQLGRHVLASLFFVSNILFWREAGYFDTSSHEKWLLHTWSLAVEWQFYLLLPLILAGLWQCFPGRRRMVLVMLAGLLGSLALSILLSPAKSTSAFYLLPTRAWEMLAGGLVYLLAVRLTLSDRQRRALEFSGFVLIVAAILVFDSSSNWPGWRAMVPVLGAVLILVAACGNSLWTGNQVAQWLGTRSYSLYLWHWPVVVGLTYAQRQGDAAIVAAGVGLTLLLGHLSYRWVETPARRSILRLQGPWRWTVLFGVTLVVAVPGAFVQLQEGVAGRFPPALELVREGARDSNPRKAACHPTTGVASPSCMFGGEHLRVVMLGDSHANALVSALASAAPEATSGVMEWSYSSCPTLHDTRRVRVSNNQCSDFVDWAIEKLVDLPADIPVVIVNRHGLYALGKNEDASQKNRPTIYFTRQYPLVEPAYLQEYARHLIDTACTLARNHPVYLVRPIPEMGVNVPNTARAMVWGEFREVSVALADYHQRNDVFWAAQDAARDQCGVRILDPLPYLCRDGRCQGARDGRPLYYDDNHLSEFGARQLIPMFVQVFADSPR